MKAFDLRVIGMALLAGLALAIAVLQVMSEGRGGW